MFLPKSKSDRNEKGGIILKQITKRIFSSAMAFALVLSLSACDGTDKPAPQDSVKADSNAPVSDQSMKTQNSGEVTQLTAVYMSTSGVPSEVQLVEDAVNDILREKISAEVDLMPITWGSYVQQLQLMLAGSETIDTFVGRGAPFLSAYSNNQLLALDDLAAEYGQGILDVIEPVFLEGGKINGKLYGITTNRDLAVGNGTYILRKDILEKHNIPYEKNMTKADIEAIFDQIHEKEPDMLVIAGFPPDTFFYGDSCYDDLGDRFAVLDNYGSDNLTVVNRYKTESFVNHVKMIYRWHQKGFISDDIASETEPNTSVIRAGRAFAYSEAYKPGIDTQATILCGYPMVSIQTQPANTSASIVQNIMWCIPSYAEHPEKSMQYLNEVYTNPEVMNLLSWGIEGKHYVETDDGHITYPEGVTSETSGYNMAAGWLFGNQYLTKVWEGDDLDVWDQMKDFNNNAIASKAMGFSFDSTEYATEIAAITNVHNEYVTTLGGGLADPDEVLPRLYDELDKAGMQKLIDGKQAQLDAWAKANDGK